MTPEKGFINNAELRKRMKKKINMIKAEKQTSRIKRQLNQRKANWRNSSPCSSMCVDTGSIKWGGTKYQNYNMSRKKFLKEYI